APSLFSIIAAKGVRPIEPLIQLYQSVGTGPPVPKLQQWCGKTTNSAYSCLTGAPTDVGCTGTGLVVGAPVLFSLQEDRTGSAAAGGKPGSKNGGGRSVFQAPKGPL